MSETKIVLLTGASRGIGKAIYEALVQSGDFKLLTPNRQQLDLNNDQSLHNYLKQSAPIDILINNAGINIVQPVEEIDQTSLEKILRVNLIAPLKLIQQAVPHMKAQQYGKIINICSVWGIVSKELRTLYSMTKFGMNGMTKSLARELGPFNILVNSVCPGYVSNEPQKNIPPEEQQRITQSIPLRRFAQPQEIACLVKFLASDENTYMTGHTIIIDGGLLA
jgi:3-oxoacyl-[acyl-carrier protein] reductase